VRSGAKRVSGRVALCGGSSSAAPQGSSEVSSRRHSPWIRYRGEEPGDLPPWTGTGSIHPALDRFQTGGQPAWNEHPHCTTVVVLMNKRCPADSCPNTL
jgi:hypothetical protein